MTQSTWEAIKLLLDGRDVEHARQLAILRDDNKRSQDRIDRLVARVEEETNAAIDAMRTANRLQKELAEAEERLAGFLKLADTLKKQEPAVPELKKVDVTGCAKKPERYDTWADLADAMSWYATAVNSHC